jgi:thiamine transporter
MKKNITLSLAYGAVAVALSVSLNFITLFKMPFGGSVTLLRMLPIVLYAYMFGTPRGFFIGAVYGVLDCLLDPYVVHPVQYILDYPLAFGLVGLAGCFRHTKSKNKILFGTAIAAAARYIPHVLSGVIFFAEFTPAEYDSALWYSMVYNAFVFVDMAFVAVAVLLLERSKSFVKTIDNIKNSI